MISKKYSSLLLMIPAVAMAGKTEPGKTDPIDGAREKSAQINARRKRVIKDQDKKREAEGEEKQLHDPSYTPQNNRADKNSEDEIVNTENLIKEFEQSNDPTEQEMAIRWKKEKTECENKSSTPENSKPSSLNYPSKLCKKTLEENLKDARQRLSACTFKLQVEEKKKIEQSKTISVVDYSQLKYTIDRLKEEKQNISHEMKDLTEKIDAVNQDSINHFEILFQSYRHFEEIMEQIKSSQKEYDKNEQHKNTDEPSVGLSGKIMHQEYLSEQREIEQECLRHNISSMQSELVQKVFELFETEDFKNIKYLQDNLEFDLLEQAYDELQKKNDHQTGEEPQENKTLQKKTPSWK